MEGGKREDDLHVEVRHLLFRRGSRVVFEDLSCGFPRRLISIILGTSGSGKTTLLRMLAGLTRPQQGEIWIDAEVELTRLAERRLQEVRRRIGMMFQRGALLDSMTVYDNLALALRERTALGEEQIRAEVQRVFEAVGLEGVDGLLPGQLSGGMTKRAALARALILQPEILLCDEPFSGLDPQTLRLVERLLMSINERLGVTMIIASHDIPSTRRMADRAVLLSEHRAICGTPDQLAASADPRVQAFFGDHDGLAEPSRPPEDAMPGRGHA